MYSDSLTIYDPVEDINKRLDEKEEQIKRVKESFVDKILKWFK